MLSAAIDLTGTPWSHVVATLRAIAVYPHEEPVWASIVIDRHWLMEAGRLIRFLDLEDHVELCPLDAGGDVRRPEAC